MGAISFILNFFCKKNQIYQTHTLYWESECRSVRRVFVEGGTHVTIVSETPPWALKPLLPPSPAGGKKHFPPLSFLLRDRHPAIEDR